MGAMRMLMTSPDCVHMHLLELACMPTLQPQQRTGDVLTLPSPRALFACAILSTGAAKGLTLPTTSPTTGGALFTKSFRSSAGHSAHT